MQRLVESLTALGDGPSAPLLDPSGTLRSGSGSDGATSFHAGSSGASGGGGSGDGAATGSPLAWLPLNSSQDESSSGGPGAAALSDLPPWHDLSADAQEALEELDANMKHQVRWDGRELTRSGF